MNIHIKLTINKLGISCVVVTHAYTTLLPSFLACYFGRAGAVVLLRDCNALDLVNNTVH